MPETYKGVSIAIEPANLNTNDTGYFILRWPGHEELVKSTHRQASFILLEARSFVDDWLEDGYIKLSEEANVLGNAAAGPVPNTLELLQDGDFVESRGAYGARDIYGPITIKDGYVLAQSRKFKGLTISIQQHTIKAIIRKGETVHRFA